ncbi:MAG: hypothetical protein GY898_31720 [Proteobacteria bacterium]|nr:hypothetical protein [Pseudomonadota bacterium]
MKKLLLALIALSALTLTFTVGCSHVDDDDSAEHNMDHGDDDDSSMSM